MGAGIWVILEAGAFAATALAAASWLFGMQGVEFASWFAGVAGVLVMIGAVVLAWSAPSAPAVAPADPPRAGPQWGSLIPIDPGRPVSAPPAPV
jgi:hypothetical protein